jgi:hypothetical protein
VVVDVDVVVVVVVVVVDSAAVVVVVAVVVSVEVAVDAEVEVAFVVAPLAVVGVPNALQGQKVLGLVLRGQTFFAAKLTRF